VYRKCTQLEHPMKSLLMRSIPVRSTFMSKHFRYISDLLLLNFVIVLQLDIMHKPKQHFLFLVALENSGMG